MCTVCIRLMMIMTAMKIANMMMAVEEVDNLTLQVSGPVYPNTPPSSPWSVSKIQPDHMCALLGDKGRIWHLTGTYERNTQLSGGQRSAVTTCCLARSCGARVGSKDMRLPAVSSNYG